jgi:drug/metabolite transporter (DMT)-like permease
VATGFELGLRVLVPVQLLTVGTLVSTAVMWGAAAFEGAMRPTPGQLRHALRLGLLNPCLYYLLLFEAYDRLPAQIAQPLNYTWAITLCLLSVPMLGQRITRRVAVGILTSYLGVVVLLGQAGTTGVAGLDWIGVGLALASTVVWALYWLLDTRSGFPATSTLAWGFTFATPVMLTLCALGPGLPRPTPEVLGYGLWVGAIEMGVSFLLWQRALRLTAHAGRLSQLIFLSPFVSFVLIEHVLGEPVRATSVIGLATIVGGIVIARRS